MQHGLKASAAAFAIAISMHGEALAQSSGDSAAGTPQTAPAATVADAPASIKDIVVTARRISERLQDVPIAVSAVTSETLRSRNVTTVSELRLVTPSLQITPSIAAGSSTPGITLRGQRQSRVLFGQDQSVAIYVNEVPQTRPQGLDATVYDLENVQVLKGPQGTLFGRNTTGGALVITPAKPTDQFEGYVDGIVGNYDWYETSGAINIPIADGVAFRTAGNIIRRDGYATNAITGQDLYDKSSESFRTSLLLGGNGRFQSLTVVDGFYSHNHGLIGHITYINPNGFVNLSSGGAALASQQRVAAQNNLLYIEGNSIASDQVNSTGVSNVTSFELNDNLTLKNVAGYRSVKTAFNSDYDDTAARVIEGISADGNRAGTADGLKWGSEELQLVGKYQGVKFIVGGFYYKESGYDRGSNISFQPRGTDQVSVSGGEGKNSSRSIFGQADVALDRIVPGLSLTAGGRYTWDTREITAEGHNNRTLPTPLFTCLVQNADRSFQPATLAGCRRTVSKKFREPTYNLSLNWKVNSDLLVYLAHRRGYRAGGFNIRAQTPGQFLPFDPEIVSDFEAGLKADYHLGSIPVRTNIAVYHSNYKDIQRTVNLIVNNLLTSTVVNAAKARINGAELELTIVPLPGLTFTAFGSVTDAKYRSFTDPASGADLSANKFADVPKYQGSITGTYSLPIGGESTLDFSGTVYRQSRFQLADINDPTGVAPGYTLVDARIEWRHVLGSAIDAGFFVKNLTNRRYVSAGSAQTAAGYSYVFPGAPRMYGVNARFKF